mgnify:CR=1 FL=1
MVERALELIGAKQLITPKDKVLLKPNYVVAKHPSTGVTSDSHVGEGGAGDTERAFDVVGIREVTARQKVRLVNLNRNSRVNVKVPKLLALEEVGVAETATRVHA